MTTADYSVFAASASDNGTSFTATGDGNAASTLTYNGASVLPGATVTLNFGDGGQPATYQGYYSNGTTEYPLILYGANYYLLGQSAVKTYTINNTAPFVHQPWHGSIERTPRGEAPGNAPIEDLRGPARMLTLNLAESELSMLTSQCLDRRIPDKPMLIDEVAAWEHDRNRRHAKADWHFTTKGARIKLKYLYPSI